ncbi:hypothetical protein [Halorubrum vacuolatum]|uniref:Uncharacterized protein n=1 Tax=Halorubrum vacuolatum TaxID=63740 RepID=A0A238W3T7_HALVU|nr:hypothetical protein [Halorubrum vacuolatum]SNR40833.1 hypothetical protein SAMN06264855_10567 [Halorubrum vacuolatum]
MPTSPLPAFPVEPPALIARQTTTTVDVEGDAKGDVETNGNAARIEVTFYEADLAPDERTARWITARKADCIPEAEWR